MKFETAHPEQNLFCSPMFYMMGNRQPFRQIRLCTLWTRQGVRACLGTGFIYSGKTLEQLYSYMRLRSILTWP